MQSTSRHRLASRVLGLALGAALFFGLEPASFACSADARVCSLHPSQAIPALAHPVHPRTVQDRYAAGAATLLGLANHQAKIIRHFPAAMGLNGYVVQIGTARDVLFYTSRNGRYFILGGLFTASGKNLSKVYAQKYLPAAAKAPSTPKPNAAQVLAGIRKTTWFTVGNPKAPKILWAGMDPNCIFCHLTFEHLLPYIQKGEVQLRIMPVGFLKPSSLPKAVTILQSKDPAKAWGYDEAHFNVEMEEGGIVPGNNLSAEDRAEVQANWAWMNRDGYYGTPLLVWKNTDGKAVVEDGMPMSIREVLQDIHSATH